MVKTAIRRHHAERLQAKWMNFLKQNSPNRNLECITFGKIYTRDPIDCGVPECKYCSWSKRFDNHRTSLRKEERDAMNDYYSGL